MALRHIENLLRLLTKELELLPSFSLMFCILVYDVCKQKQRRSFQGVVVFLIHATAGVDYVSRDVNPRLAPRTDGSTYATFHGSGPSTRRKVAGFIVPAPTWV